MNDKIQTRPDITAGKHLIGRFEGDRAGPKVVVFGSLHGNEAAGALALERVASKLTELSQSLRGSVYLLAGNTRALLESVRFIDSDLNRHWTPGNIANNSNGSTAGTRSEDKEQSELLEILAEILETARDEVYALDLHSTSAEGSPFATVGDTLRNRAFAQKFPITILLGLLGWTHLARRVRGKLLSLREEDFVVAARIAGSTDTRIIARHLLPSFLSYIIVDLSISFPYMILAETSLSFVGLGLRAPVISWGVLLQDAQNIQAIALYPWLFTPVAFVIVSVMAFSFVGDGMRDAADPYSR